MLMKKSLLRLFLSFVLLQACFACTEEYIEPEEYTYTKQISVVFSPGGLGDSGYNDLILTGFQKLRKSNPDGVKIMYYMPDSLPQARKILEKWLEQKNAYNDELFVLASSDYENMLKDVLSEQYPDNEIDPEKDILLLESYNQYSLPVYTLRITTFGASYLAGVQAATEYGEKPALVVAANPYDKPVLSAVNGFMEGWKSVSAEKADTLCMAGDWKGFIMAEEAYQGMHEWSKEYGFVFSVAGGTNNGIYRYLREHPGSMKTVGMDIDQSYLCADIIGSVLKHLDNIIYDSLQEWIKSGKIQTMDFHGLIDGYAEWYSPVATDKEIIETAIRKEHEYETQ